MNASLRAKLTLACMAAAVAFQVGAGPRQEVAKPRVAIWTVEATEAVKQQAAAQGKANELSQIVEMLNSQLPVQVSATHRFDVVGRSDLGTVVKEWNLVDFSGSVDRLDAQTAKSLSTAGARFVAALQIGSFQDITQRTALEGPLGKSQAERRTIQLQATLKIYDSTSGVLSSSSAVQLSDSATDEVLPGVVQDGRPTNALIGQVATAIGQQAVGLIVAALSPARVLAYTNGQVTFNRAAGSGAAVGQYWEVLAIGEALVDPDTGENLGSEEVGVGWVQVMDAGTSTSRAQAMQDFGIDKGCLMRLRDALPAGVSSDSRASGSAARTPRGSSPGSAAAAPATAPAQTAEDGTIGTGAAAPVRLAIFIKVRPGSMPGDKVSVFEDDIVAALAKPGIAVIRREDVINAVKHFAEGGPNTGTPQTPEEEFGRLTSNSTSARNFAQQLGADGIIIAAIDALDETTLDWADPQTGVSLAGTEFTLRTTWEILGGSRGESLASGLSEPSRKVRANQQGKLVTNPLNELLRDAGRQIAAAATTAMTDQLSRISLAAPEHDIQVGVFLADLYLPNVVRTTGGEFKVETGNVGLGPMNVTILLDGVAAGTAPGTVRVTEGLHSLRLERPGLEPIERMVNVRPGLALNIPMRMSADGLLRWQEETAFMEGLKENEILREAQIEKARAVADLIRKMNVNLNLDTANVRNLSVGADTLWGQLIESPD